MREAGSTDPSQSAVSLDPEGGGVVGDVDEEAGVAPGRTESRSLRLEDDHPPLGPVGGQAPRGRESGEARPHDDAVAALARRRPPRRRGTGELCDPAAAIVVLRKAARVHAVDGTADERG